MENQNQVQAQTGNSKKEWGTPELKTFGAVTEITQHWRCQHGHTYPCPICTPPKCGTS